MSSAFFVAVSVFTPCGSGSTSSNHFRSLVATACNWSAAVTGSFALGDAWPKHLQHFFSCRILWDSGSATQSSQHDHGDDVDVSIEIRATLQSCTCEFSSALPSAVDPNERKLLHPLAQRLIQKTLLRHTPTSRSKDVDLSLNCACARSKWSSMRC